MNLYSFTITLVQVILIFGAIPALFIWRLTTSKSKTKGKVEVFKFFNFEFEKDEDKTSP